MSSKMTAVMQELLTYPLLPGMESHDSLSHSSSPYICLMMPSPACRGSSLRRACHSASRSAYRCAPHGCGNPCGACCTTPLLPTGLPAEAFGTGFSRPRILQEAYLGDDVMDVSACDGLGVQVHGVAEVGGIHHIQQDVAQEQQHHHGQHRTDDAQRDGSLQQCAEQMHQLSEHTPCCHLYICRDALPYLAPLQCPTRRPPGEHSSHVLDFHRVALLCRGM